MKGNNVIRQRVVDNGQRHAAEGVPFRFGRVIFYFGKVAAVSTRAPARPRHRAHSFCCRPFAAICFFLYIFAPS